MAIKAPTFEEIGASPSFESIGTEPIDITTILDPAEEERQIKETLDLSEQYGIDVNDSQKFVAVPEPGLFRSMLNKVKESIRERTGYFEPPIYGPEFREEKPFRTAGKMAAFYGAEAVSGLSLTALDVLTNKTVGDKTLADAVARITGFEPTSKEIGAGESVKYIAAFTPAGKIVRAGTKLIPAAQTLKTILSSGLTFATTDAAIQFSKNITEGKPVDWSRVHAAGGVGVLWGTGEVAVAAVLSKIVKGMDKYWGEKGMDVAEKLRPPGTSLKEQYARQQAEIRTDINRAKEVFRKTGKMPEDLMKKYVHGKPPEGSVFKPPEAVPVKKPVQAPITKVKKAVPVPEAPAKAITKPKPTITLVKAKQPWEMTRKEYIKEGDWRENKEYYRAVREAEGKRKPSVTKAGRLTDATFIRGVKAQQVGFTAAHQKYIKEAIEQGKPVPRAVLEEYKSEKWAQEALAKAGKVGEVEYLQQWEELILKEVEEEGTYEKTGMKATTYYVPAGIKEKLKTLGKTPQEYAKDYVQQHKTEILEGYKEDLKRKARRKITPTPPAKAGVEKEVVSPNLAKARQLDVKNMSDQELLDSVIGDKTNEILAELVLEQTGETKIDKIGQKLLDQAGVEAKVHFVKPNEKILGRDRALRPLADGVVRYRVDEQGNPTSDYYITLKEGKRYKKLSTLRHEIQHIIDHEKEGFKPSEVKELPTVSVVKKGETLVEALRRQSKGHFKNYDLFEFDYVLEQLKLTPTPPAKAGVEKKGKLPGGRQAGGTTFIPDIAAELQTIGHKLIHNPVELTKATVEMAKRNMKSAINHMRTLGPAGEKLADEIERITFDVTKKTGNDLADIRNIFKGVTKPDREVIAKLVNGRTDPEAQPEKLIKKAKQLRDVLDRTMIEANELGMERRVQGKKIPVGGKGKAFPQVPNEKGQKFLEEASAKGKSSAAVFAWAQTQVSAGKYETVDKAIAALQAFRAAQFRGINRYLETERIELPVDMIEWDGTRTLPSLVERNWMTIEGVRKWGENFDLTRSRVEQIKGEYGVDEAMRVKTYIETSFGIKSPASRQAQVISNKIRGYQFIAKVGTSPLTILRNMFDRIAKGFTISPVSTIKTFGEYPPFINQFIESSQKLEEHMIRSGVVFGHGSISEGYEAGSVITELASAPFSSSERGNQVFIAQVQYHKLLDDISKLKGREEVTNRLHEVVKGFFGQSTEQIRMRVEKAGGGALVDKLLKGEQITADEMNYILHQAVRDKAYPMILSTKPIWYDSHPFMKVLAQFKTWPVRQTNMIWQDVVKYTVKSKDPSRLIGFLAGTLIAGELYNIMRDFLFDKKESILSQYFKDPTQRELGWAILNDLFDGGVVGVFADLSYGLYDWVTGVSARSGKNVWDTIGHIKKAPMLTPQALERLMIQEITPYRQVKKLAEKVDRAWVNKNNISSQHYKWRSLGWEWKEQKKNPSVTDKVQAWTDKVMFGFEDYGIGEDTLAYELTSRQIVAGDVDDATKYLIYILNRADDKKAKQAAIKQSMKNRSPLGKIAEKDRTEFLSQFSPTERVEAMKVQAKYLSMYNRALAMAIGKTK